MDIASAFSSLSAAIGLAQSALNARDERKIADAKQELARVLIDVQNSCLDLQQKLFASAQAERAAEDTCRDLAAQVEKLQQRITDHARYELAELSEGVLVLRLKGAEANGEPSHYLCQPCMDNRDKKAVLQRHEEGWVYWMQCPECRYNYRTNESAPVSI